VTRTSAAGPATPRGHVLVVDDDAAIRAALDLPLRRAGFTVSSAADGLTGLEMVRRARPDVAILDVGMPGLNGVALVRRLRAEGYELPVCILSARDQVDDRVAGLEAGADDYIPKPFAVREVVARLEALLRRRGSAPGAASTPAVLTVDDLVVDPGRRMVRRGDDEVTLTRREFDLLECLAINAGLVLSREQLLSLVWGYDFDLQTNVVDVFVGYLRRKLETGGRPRLIHTVRGVGFVLRSGDR
jgi:two-component system response regulator PrrA